MVTYSQSINNRRVSYFSLPLELDAFSALDLSDWVVLVIADDATSDSVTTFANMCIDKNVLYMTATGKACSKLDDLFDELMVMRRIFKMKLPSHIRSEDDVLMTTWDHDFAEAFWFITSVANYEQLNIDSVIVANFTGADYSESIGKMITDINNGWLPGD